MSKKKEFSEEVIECYEKCLNYFPDDLKPKTDSAKNKWLDTIEKLNRLDKVEFVAIEYIVAWARKDDFWSTNFMSMLKLRRTNKDGVKYVTVFIHKIKDEQKRKQSSQKGGPDQGYREGLAKRLGIVQSK